jgi:DNA-binding CsgD family transcriptional regulator
VTLAGVVLRLGSAERAARLLGSADALLDGIGGVLFPAWREDLQCFTAEARAVLSDATFDASWAEGRTIPLTDIAFAAMDLLAETARPGSPESFAAIAPAQGIGITGREAEVLRLLAAGQSNREIAATLVLSVRTVERHIENIYAKLGVHGQAARAGLLAD